jgi:short-subunit dehydrogenase
VPSLSETLQKFSTVIVTGGSSGIGKSFIELSGRLHPDLLICNLSRRTPDISSSSQLNLRHFACDLAAAETIERVAVELQDFIAREAPAGRILLINNSGFGAYGAFPLPSLEHQLEMTDVNVRAVLHLTGRLLPLLKARGGAIITVASAAAFQPTPWMAAYGASKAFVLHWSLALDAELRGSGVRTLAVCPGPVGTEFFRRAGLRNARVSGSLSQTCEAVVTESLRALAAGRSQVVTGWKNRIITFIGAKLPKPLAARIAAKVLAGYAE